MSAGFGTAVDPEMMNEAMKRAEDSGQPSILR